MPDNIDKYTEHPCLSMPEVNSLWGLIDSPQSFKLEGLLFCLFRKLLLHMIRKTDGLTEIILSVIILQVDAR